MTTSKRPTRLWIPGLSTEGRLVDPWAEESSTELQKKKHENSIVMHSLIQVLRWFFLFFFGIQYLILIQMIHQKEWISSVFYQKI